MQSQCKREVVEEGIGDAIPNAIERLCERGPAGPISSSFDDLAKDAARFVRTVLGKRLEHLGKIGRAHV